MGYFSYRLMCWHLLFVTNQNLNPLPNKSVLIHFNKITLNILPLGMEKKIYFLNLLENETVHCYFLLEISLQVLETWAETGELPWRWWEILLQTAPPSCGVFKPCHCTSQLAERKESERKQFVLEYLLSVVRPTSRVQSGGPSWMFY